MVPIFRPLDLFEKREETEKKNPCKILEKKDMRNFGCFWGICKSCGYKVIQTCPPRDKENNEPCVDYWWYCINKNCEHHHPGEGTYDMECPDWVELGPEK